MKFLIDMNLSPLWVPFLVEKGFASVHWSTVGQPWAPDSEIFDFAATHDWNRLHARSGFRYVAGFVTGGQAQCHSSPQPGRSTVRDWRHCAPGNSDH